MEVKFYIINADTSYRALLERPWIHNNYVIPSTLHQCMKYKMGEMEFMIKGNIQPFDVHKVRYKDAHYFLQPILGIKVEKHKKKEANRKEIYKKPPKALVVIHLGSDSESFDSTDSDKEEEKPSSWKQVKKKRR